MKIKEAINAALSIAVSGSTLGEERLMGIIETAPPVSVRLSESGRTYDIDLQSIPYMGNVSARRAKVVSWEKVETP